MLSQQVICEMFNYDPATGLLTWRAPASNRAAIGGEAGWFQKPGYRYVGIAGKKFLVHRVIWLYVTGKWPAAQIDHRDTNRINNRWNNLREATHSQNEMNKGMRGGLRRNKAGVKGVYYDARRNKWAAEIRAAGVRHHLGRFPTKAAAAMAHKKAAQELHGLYARH